jgi:hypothetical protein
MSGPLNVVGYLAGVLLGCATMPHLARSYRTREPPGDGPTVTLLFLSAVAGVAYVVGQGHQEAPMLVFAVGACAGTAVAAFQTLLYRRAPVVGDSDADADADDVRELPQEGGVAIHKTDNMEVHSISV